MSLNLWILISYSWLNDVAVSIFLTSQCSLILGSQETAALSRSIPSSVFITFFLQFMPPPDMPGLSAALLSLALKLGHFAMEFSFFCNRLKSMQNQGAGALSLLLLLLCHYSRTY